MRFLKLFGSIFLYVFGVAIVILKLFEAKIIANPALFTILVLIAICLIVACWQSIHEGEVVKQKNRNNALKEESKLWRDTLVERSSGYPSLLSIIKKYDEKFDEGIPKYMETKSHPAKRSAQIIRDESRRRREAEQQARFYQSIIEYYEDIAPFLIELKNDLVDNHDSESFREFNASERADPVTKFLTKQEYRTLSISERNQLALERYVKRPKSKREIGSMFERYIGFRHECKGYDVEYVGIIKGFEDLGRDLICTKGNYVKIVQCKYWSQYRNIYEKYIFQFFGTVFIFKKQNPQMKVRGVFVTSTKVSETARQFANELDIELLEGVVMDKNYPMIKCNISRSNGQKIYHLPFDQQYDKTKIDVRRGELYAKNVTEAEEAGFRRAFRWRGSRPADIAH